MEKLYLVCDNCGEAFDSLDPAYAHIGKCAEEPTFQIKPESEAMQVKLNFDEAADLVVDFFARIGYTSDEDTDDTGEMISASLQNHLVEACMRSEAVATALGNFSQIKQHKVKALELDAFNLWPGAVLVEEDSFWVVVTRQDAPVLEHVLVYLRQADLPEDGTVNMKVLDLSYQDSVYVVGSVRNPADPEDNNWGVN